jgi:tetratricopeptide (TPR) repeat protein
MRYLLLALTIAAAPAYAECPPVTDRSAELAALFEGARNAPNDMASRVFSDQMWEIWTDAPDDAAAALLNTGMSARRVADYLAARDAFDRLVEYCPHWAEGYNQRAFIAFLSGDYEAALVDLERTVEINSEHVGALSGLALTLTALGREAEAQDWLRKALALNPWIPERGLLKEPPGQEL